MKYYGHCLILIIYMNRIVYYYYYYYEIYSVLRIVFRLFPGFLPGRSPRRLSPLGKIYIYASGQNYSSPLVFYTPYDAADYTAEEVLHLSST